MSRTGQFAANLSLLVARLTLGLWVGGAILFVITSIGEQQHQGFDSPIRDQLATIRFPSYYVYGGVCLAASLTALTAAVVLCEKPLRGRMLAALLMTMLSAGIAAADYVWVYQPLQQLITPPGKARTAEFAVLHDWSRKVNELHLSLAAIAAIIVCYPEMATHRATPQSSPE